jgi:hypothetical protein
VKKLSDTLGAPVTASRERRIVATPLGEELLALCHELFASFAHFDARSHRVMIGAQSPEPAHADHPS